MSTRSYRSDKFRGVAIIEAVPMYEWHCPKCGEHYLRHQNYFDWSSDDGDHAVVTCIKCERNFLVIIKDGNS